MMKHIRVFRVRLLVIISLILALSCNRDIPSSFSFTTGGETVYHIRTGVIKNGRRAVVTASIHGVIQVFTSEGKMVWKAETDGGFPFDLCVDDIDGDGLDEVIVASGNGTLYAFDQDGKQLWTFSKIPPLYQVSVAHDGNGNATILTGGPGQILYSISPSGELVNSIPTEHCIRHIRTGNVMKDGKDYAVMATASSGLSGILSLMLIDPAGLSVVWKKSNLGNFAPNTGRRFFSMLVSDLTGDGSEDILLSGGWGENGRIYAFDNKGDELFSAADNKIPNIPYRMNLLRKITLPNDTCILGHFGNVMIIYEQDGTLREVFRGPYSYTDCHFDPGLKTLFMGSPVSGGDGVYAFHLDKPEWKDDFKNKLPAGKMAEIEKNLVTLNRQISDFIPPAYQPEPRQSIVIAPKPGDKDFKNISFIESITLSQKITNRDELWCKETDQRRSYDLTSDELVKIIREREAAGQDFVIWAGHGTAIHFPLSTFKRIIEVGPEHLRGFIFAEMEGVDDHMQEVVEKIILPVAELCKQHKKLIVFRNKNIFWSGTCYVPFWRKVLLNDRYSDVIVPGLEETNCRTQELSLIGRIGLWQTGSFDHWLGRATTDNSNFDRMFEWAGQQVINHHLRNLVSSASLGADIFYNTLQITDLSLKSENNKSTLYDQLVPFYDMLEKGIIYIPERSELLSLSEMAIGMKDPPAGQLIKHGTNGHRYWFPVEGKKEMVFDRLDTYFGGSTLDPYDYSYYAMNVQRRMTNFMPETPYGMTVIIPAETDTSGRFRKIIVTDGQYFYDEKGLRQSASEYKPVVLKALTEAAGKLPVLVKGDVHWSVVKLDEKHLRITLIDPGYLDPADRNAEIILQHIKGRVCTDILSRESLPIMNGVIKVTVPAGFFSIFDVTTEK